MITTRSLLLPLALAAGLGLSAAAPSAAGHKFGEPPLNAMGVAGLDDLRGMPVVIDFWGKN